jgi:putative endonuclease
MNADDERRSALRLRARREARAAGLSAEAVAAAYLRRRGYRILARGYVARGGEIDIVAMKDDAVAFVEVKARATLDAALTAVTPQKARRLSAACRRWLVENEWAMALTLRGDLLALAPRRFPRHLEAAIPLDLGHA